MNEYKTMLHNIYDAICAALTEYESAGDTEEYDKGFALYQDIVEIEEQLSSFIN